jgi:hypothetical protein
MRIDRLKQSAIVDLEGQISEKQGQIDHLEKQTGASLWLSDLEEFEATWKGYSEHRAAESVAVASGQGAGVEKKKPTIRAKKPVAKK